MPEYYTINEVSAMLKVNRQTVYNWHRQGKIELVKVGARNRITPEELARFIDDCKKGGKKGGSNADHS